MKENILKLRSEGKSYNEIAAELGCSKSTVSYYCGSGQREKTTARTRDKRKATVISQRTENFQYDRRVKDKAEDFQRKRLSHKLGKRKMTFTWKDVIEKFGWETACYLTGRKIDLKEPRSYHFDHVVPYSKGGSGLIDNLGIACRDANVAKSDLSVAELLELCKDILTHNGYMVTKE